MGVSEDRSVINGAANSIAMNFCVTVSWCYGSEGCVQGLGKV